MTKYNEQRLPTAEVFELWKKGQGQCRSLEKFLESPWKYKDFRMQYDGNLKNLQCVFTILNKNPYIQTFYLNYYREYPSETHQEICNFLTSNKTIKSFGLSTDYYGSTDLPIAEALRQNNTIESLYYSGFPNQDVASILEMLNGNSTNITRLCILNKQASVSEEYIGNIINLIKNNNTISSLHIGGANIKNTQALEFLRAIKDNKSIVSFDIMDQGIKISESDYAKLAGDYLKSNNTTLTYFNKLCDINDGNKFRELLENNQAIFNEVSSKIDFCIERNIDPLSDEGVFNYFKNSPAAYNKARTCYFDNCHSMRIKPVDYYELKQSFHRDLQDLLTLSRQNSDNKTDLTEVANKQDNNEVKDVVLCNKSSNIEEISFSKFHEQVFKVPLYFRYFELSNGDDKFYLKVYTKAGSNDDKSLDLLGFMLESSTE